MGNDMSCPATDGLVASVADDKFQIVINLGSIAGVREGFRYLVYREGDEILDPKTRESLGKLEVVCGTGIVTHVQEKMSTLDSCEKEVRHKKTITTQDTLLSLFASPRREVDEPTEHIKPFKNVDVGCCVRLISR